MSRRLDTTLNAVTAVAAVLVAATVGYRTITNADSAPERRRPEYLREVTRLLPISSGEGGAAAVTVLAFMDLQCPYCARFHQALALLDKRYPDATLLVRYVHYPLSNHPAALPAAHAADCADRQSRFMSFVSETFAVQDSLGHVPYKRLAARAGVKDTIAFEACFESSDAPPKVLAGIAAADSLKLGGTPSVIVNGWLMPGVPSLDELSRVIDSLLKGRRPFSNRWERWMSALAS